MYGTQANGRIHRARATDAAMTQKLTTRASVHIHGSPRFSSRDSSRPPTNKPITTMMSDSIRSYKDGGEATKSAGAVTSMILSKRKWTILYDRNRSIKLRFQLVAKSIATFIQPGHRHEQIVANFVDVADVHHEAHHGFACVIATRLARNRELRGSLPSVGQVRRVDDQSVTCQRLAAFGPNLLARREFDPPKGEIQYQKSLALQS